MVTNEQEQAEITKRQKSIKKNAALNVLRTLAALFFPLIGYMYVTRVFGTDAYGKVSFSKSYVNGFLTLATLEMATYGARGAAQVRDRRDELNRFTSEMMSLNVFTMLISYIVLAASVFLIPKMTEYKWLVLIYSLEILFQVLSIEWFYTAIEDYAYITIRTYIFQILALIATIVFIRTPDDIYKYVIIQSSAIGLTSLANLFHSRRYVSIRLEFDSRIWRHFRPLALLFCIRLLSNIFRQLDTLMLGFMKNDSVVGLYSTGDKMSAMLSSVICAIATVMLPRISYYIENGREKEIEDLVVKTAQVILMISIPMSIGVALFSEPAVLIFSGQQFREAITTTGILSLRIVLSPINTLLAWNLLIPMRMERRSLFAMGMAALIDFIANMVLIPILAQNGAAIGTIIAEVVELVVLIICVKRFIPVLGIVRKGMLYLGASLIVILLYVSSAPLISNIFVQLAVVFMLSLFIYPMILMLMKDEMILYIFSLVKTRIGRR